MPGSPAHLSRRFLDVLTASRLSETETAAVRSWLSTELASLFFSQPTSDQRHGYQAAVTVVSSRVDDPDVITTALMHDVGKRHARLGVIGRSLTTLAIKLRLPLSDRMTAYRDHGLIAAGELADIGAPPLAVDFALHHHGDRPESISHEIWELLQIADQPPKPSSMFGGGITSNSA